VATTEHVEGLSWGKMQGPALRKSLGQHHLRSGALCRPLVEFLRPEGRTVLEVGPGGGVLTAELVRSAERVLAVELDLAWAVQLRRRRLPVGLWVGDALQVAWERLPPGSCVAGNLPYGIATPLIESILPHAATVTRAAFLVQREVADRLLAAPGCRDYGVSSVLLALAARRRHLGRVRRGSFQPPPKVEGAFIGLELVPLPLEPQLWLELSRLVRTAFRSRRKTLRNSLASSWGREEAASILDAAGIDPRRRPESLAPEEFLILLASRRDYLSSTQKP
jgi:16S rRNA (adenine1518-N6/adenine1519-N6)-dimethyltransferase